jgi:hypothetical protein
LLTDPFERLHPLPIQPSTKTLGPRRTRCLAAQ